MERALLAEKNLDECAARGAEALRAGKVILYPTDTLYGLGADAFSDEAVEAVYAIKGRDARKPIHAVAADIAMMEAYALVSDDARLLAEAFLPGALTIILRKREDAGAGIARNIETIGFRIPDHPLCAALARAFGAPFTTTSANIAGAPSFLSVEEILGQLGDAAGAIDLVIDGGALPERAPSTVVDCSGGRPNMLREGAIPRAEIWNVLEA